MRIGVIDVGSNTVRLLVAEGRAGRVRPVHRDRAYLQLASDIERHGWISDTKLRETLVCVRDFVRCAREHGAGHVEVVVTAPGRQSANADELVAALAHASGAAVRVLSAEDEGRLAYLGAVDALRHVPDSVAVVDVGGGSTEVIVGTPDEGAVWARSYELGCLRPLASMLAGDPPGKAAVVEARAEVRRRVEGLTPPLPKVALATGGSARALRKVVGKKLGAQELEVILRKLSKRPAAEVADAYGLDEQRARTLAGGTIILAEVQRRLGVPLEVSRAGMREAVARSLLLELAAA